MSTKENLPATFFGGCADGKLLLQRCSNNHLQYPPAPLCRQCGGSIEEWVESTREGTVEAFSLVQRAPMPAFDPYVPYMVAVVKLREGPLVETWLKRDGRTPGAAEVKVGEPVTFGFETINGQAVPVAALR